MTADHLGSARIITNENGVVTNRRDYAAFGDETITAQRTSGLKYFSADEIRKGYTGYEKDDESGLDFAQARYYNSTHGRFTSIDPLTASANTKNPQTFNRYSYVLNSPYKFVDPLGLIVTFCCKQQDIKKQIEKDFGTVFADGKLSKLDKKSLAKLVKKLSPFYTKAARAGANAQRQINNAAERPPKVTKVVTETVVPSTTKQTTSSISGSVGGGAKTNQELESEVETGTDGVNSKNKGNISTEETGNGNFGMNGTVTITEGTPSTKTTTESVPDNSVNTAYDDLKKAEDSIPTMAEEAAKAINDMPVTGVYFSFKTLSGGKFEGNMDVNSFDLEPYLQRMFEAGRDSMRPK